MSIIRLCYHAGITTRSQPPSTFNYIYSNRSQPSGDQVATVPKIATQDTTLTVNNIGGGKTTFPVPSGTEIFFHIAGLHRNRRLSGSVS